MNDPQPLQVLIYLDDGQEALVEPQHAPFCVKGSTARRWIQGCEGCKFDLLANELLALYRPRVNDVNHREEISDAQA